MITSQPRNSLIRGAIFKESIQVGVTFLSNAEVLKQLQVMHKKFIGMSYNILDRNCISFTREFLSCLLGNDQGRMLDGSIKLPPYVDRMIRFATKVRPCLPTPLKKDIRDQPLLFWEFQRISSNHPSLQRSEVTIQDPPM